MSKEEQNSDTEEYDEESFDNESSSEEVSSDEESIQEESSDGQSLDELLPDNSSIKSVLDSVHHNQTVEQNSNDLSSVSSEDAEETPDLISCNSDVKPKNNAPTFLEVSGHEINKSESVLDDLAEVDLTESVKSLTMHTEPCPAKIDVPSENQNLEADLYSDDGTQMSSCHQSEIEFNVTSQTPTSFNSENYAAHMEITQKPTRSNTSMQHERNTHRRSLSFSNERMREIERHNQILLRKILTQKPRTQFLNQKIPCPKLRMTTSAVNRKKQQRQIDLDNQVLKRKIEAIALRRPQIL